MMEFLLNFFLNQKSFSSDEGEQAKRSGLWISEAGIKLTVLADLK